MHRYSLALLAVGVVLAFPALVCADAPTEADRQLYSESVGTMRALPEPTYAAFIARATWRGLSDITVIDDHGRAKLLISWGGRSEPSSSWNTSYRTSDNTSSIASGPQNHLLSHSPLFSPTWTSVYDLIRFGFNGRPKPADPGPQATASSNPSLKVIGVSSAIGSSFYTITSANAAKCTGGTDGRHLRLQPRGDPSIYPLTDITIDLASMRFCSVRFRLKFSDADDVESTTGFAELHFGPIGEYWMATSDDADIVITSVRSEVQRATWHFTYDHVQFPDTLDDALFTLQTTQTTK
jgi:hypothetical protein